MPYRVSPNCPRKKRIKKKPITALVTSVNTLKNVLLPSLLDDVIEGLLVLGTIVGFQYEMIRRAVLRACRSF